MDVRRDKVVELAHRLLYTPYRWGGDDPSGLDCSGLIVELYQSVGWLKRGEDLNAQSLRQRFSSVAPELVAPGDLVFWLDSPYQKQGAGRAVHVGLIIDPRHLYIGADGGGSSTKTLADAWARNAYVKVRPVTSRGSNEDRRFASPTL